LNQIRKRLTYANVMSSIAVFLVLGGATALAASHLGKNSVGTKQLKSNAVTAKKIKKSAVTEAKIKKNAVTGAKIKNGAVTGAKVMDGSLTGTDINLATLGTVPSSATANALAGRTAFNFFMPAGVRDVGTFGAFTIKAQCLINQGGEDIGQLLLYTTEANSAMDDNSGSEEESFGPEQSPIVMFEEEEATGQTNIEAGYGFVAVAPGGTAIASDNQAVGVNVAGHLGQCYFSGIIEKLG
jgi:hypothetical protein